MFNSEEYMRVVDKKDARGSLKWIRSAVNENVEYFNQEVRASCHFNDTMNIEWVSPLASDDFAEYRDEAFLERLGVNLQKKKLTDFWPNLGPQWDALGRVAGGGVLLLEAKANIPENISPGTGASKNSKDLIEKSLEETKTYLRVEPSISWSGKFYQYANRLSHLYLLRELNGIPAYLVFVYFIGDKDVKGPDTIGEWKEAISVAKGVLGLGQENPLSKYIAEVFINVRELK